MIRKLVAEYSGDQVVVIFDAKGPTFHNDIYPAYKANRPPMPEELRADRTDSRHDSCAGVAADLYFRG